MTVLSPALAEISAAAAERSKGSNVILQSAQSPRGVSSEAQSGSREMTSDNAVATGTISGVSAASKPVGPAISEIRSGTELIHDAMAAPNDQVRRIVEIITGIHTEMARFRT